MFGRGINNQVDLPCLIKTWYAVLPGFAIAGIVAAAEQIRVMENGNLRPGFTDNPD